MDIKAIDNLLVKMRLGAAGAAGAAGAGSASGAGAPAGQVDFGAMLKKSIDQVNASQVQASKGARDFELGVPGADLNDVMISMQKANLSFQQMVQVRNRLVSAYHDIMNMQV